MTKNKGFLTILIVSATVFFSNACIMIVELVASRLIARHLGSSLYTWTSIIGIVLAGISVGNYIGGRLADKYQPRKTLALLFFLASVACVTIIILNNFVGQWTALWYLNWPLRVFSHVTLVFLVPSVLLGTISPVAATMALKTGLPTGRTIGEIYAWGTAGSIVGTFLAGFYLIATLGTVAIIWTISGALLLMAVLYWSRFYFLYLWAIVLFALAYFGMASTANAQSVGHSIGLREKHDPAILYQDETQYCWVAVKQTSENPDKRDFIQDKLKHSEIDMDNPDNLLYFYTHIYASITHGLRPEPDPINVMIIGGGGYVYPRYVEKHWPGSRVDVVEIDAGVTEAAHAAFGLSRDSSIRSHTMDARNFVDDLLLQQRRGQNVPKYDFIYEDAINDYYVPYQLVTHEFNEMIAQTLKPDGVYLVNMIEVYDSGLFLGSMIQTLQKTFPYVYVLTEYAPHSIRNTFVMAASFQEIDLRSIIGQYVRGADIWYLDEQEMDGLRQRAHFGVITDDYAPVENMLAPVVRRTSTDFLAINVKNKARDLKQLGKFNESIEQYLEMIRIEPTLSLLGYNEIGLMLAMQNKTEEAIAYFLKAIDYNERAETKVNVAGIHLNLALLLRDTDSSRSRTHYARAVEGYKKELEKDPKSLRNTLILANTLKDMGNVKEAIEYFRKAVDLNPYDPQQHIILAQIYEDVNDLDSAIAVLKKAVGFFEYVNQAPRAEPLRKYLEFVEYKKAAQNITGS